MKLGTWMLAAAGIGIGAVIAAWPSAAPVAAQTPVTFSEHVAPIVFANCTPCHRPGEAAPFQLLSYRDARPLAKAMAAAATARVMPPWKPGPREDPFHGARVLTAQQIETLQRWADGGAPEGDP